MIIKIIAVTLFFIGTFPFFSFAILSLIIYPTFKDEATSPFLHVGNYSVALMPLCLSIPIILSFLISFIFFIVAINDMEIIHY